MSKKVVLFGNTAESLVNFRGSLLESIVNSGNEVYAISPACETKQKTALKNIGVNHIEISFDRTGMNVFSDLVLIYSIYMTLKKIKPESLITYALKPIFYGSLAARFLKIQHFPMLVGLGYTAGYTFSEDSKTFLKGYLLGL